MEQIAVGVDIDEARRQTPPMGIDALLSFDRDPRRNDGNPARLNGNGTRPARISAAVYDTGVFNDKIEHGRLALKKK